MIWLNIGCGDQPAPSPWVNADIRPQVRPDVLLVYGRALPWDEGAVERLYLGHVLTHIERNDVIDYLEDCHRVMAPGAEILVVGPDINRALWRWRDGDDQLTDVLAAMEDDYLNQRAEWQYEGHGHWWTCYEARVMRMLNEAGFDDVTAMDIHPAAEVDFDGWPVADLRPAQMAVRAVRR